MWPMATHADLVEAADDHEAIAAILDRMIANSLAQASNLGPMMTRAFGQATFERLLGMTDRIPASIRLGVECGLAIFAIAPHAGEQVTYSLAGQTVTRPGTIGLSAAHGGNWEQVFYGAVVLHDLAAVRAICEVPPALMQSSSTRGPSYTGLWIRVLQGLVATGAIDGPLLMQALEATDPERLPEDVRDAALYLRVPAIEVLYRIALGDAAATRAALETALDKHRTYWTLSDDNRRDHHGFVSWPLSALAEIARRRGLAVDVESDYLIRLPAAAPAVAPEPAPDPDTAAWRAALAGSFTEIVGFLIPRMSDEAAVERALLAELRRAQPLAAGVGKAILALPTALRHRVLPIAARDPRPEVRRAVFLEWAPERVRGPREGAALLPPDAWLELLRTAARDADADVRRAAALLAADSGVLDQL
jgi:hypothetical protein